MDLAAAVTEGFGEDLVIVGHGDALEDVVLGVRQGGRRALEGVQAMTGSFSAEAAERFALLWSETGLLAGFDFGSGDFDELVGAGVADEPGDFVVGGLMARVAAMNSAMAWSRCWLRWLYFWIRSPETPRISKPRSRPLASCRSSIS